MTDPNEAIPTQMRAMARVPMAGIPEATSDPQALVDIEALANKANDERLTLIEKKLELANQQLVTLINYVEELLPHARRAAVMMENNPVVKLREAFRGRR